MNKIVVIMQGYLLDWKNNTILQALEMSWTDLNEEEKEIVDSELQSDHL